MNVIQAIQDYVNKMVTSVPGMKVMLLDKETTGIVSMVYSQSQILQKEVYLIEKLDIKNHGKREVMAHLKAVCFLRPTRENFEALQQELRDPKYGEYYLFFSNVIKNTSYIEELAEADEHEVVQQLHEFFGDYYAINPDTFTLNMDSVVSMNLPSWKENLDRTLDGIASCLLSLKKQPVIRFAAKSDMAQKCVSELQKRFTQESGLFEFRKTDVPPLLLILDRRDDPVTPLLTPWTYQSMVHEIFGLKNNVVDLKGVPGIKKELEQIVLSAEQDTWFKSAMYLNFGDLGVKIKELVDDYQKKTKTNQNIESIEDIKKFVENFPEFKKLSGNVTKHVTLMGELSRTVEVRALLDVSELEQEIANASNHSDQLKRLYTMLDDPRFTVDDKLRVVLLYALRYEGNSGNESRQLMDKLIQLGLEKEKHSSIEAFLKYAGQNLRGSDIFGKAPLKGLVKNLRRGLKGVENIYTEHKPYLKDILDALAVGKLKEIEFPYAPGTKNVITRPPQDVIVFIIGGVTYDEAVTIHEYNASNSGMRIILGGTSILNSKTFIRDTLSILQ